MYISVCVCTLLICICIQILSDCVRTYICLYCVPLYRSLTQYVCTSVCVLHKYNNTIQILSDCVRTYICLYCVPLYRSLTHDTRSSALQELELLANTYYGEVRTYVCMYVRMYICTQVNPYVHTYVCIYCTGVHPFL